MAPHDPLCYITDFIVNTADDARDDLDTNEDELEIFSLSRDFSELLTEHYRILETLDDGAVSRYKHYLREQRDTGKALKKDIIVLRERGYLTREVYEDMLEFLAYWDRSARERE